MAGSFKLPKVALKQKKDLELPSFAWKSRAKKKKLGSGSFGSVYLATHGSTSQHQETGRGQETQKCVYRFTDALPKRGKNPK